MIIDSLGWYDKQNIGDEAFKEVIKDFFSGHKVNFIHPPNLPVEGDIVVLGGGAVVSPFYLKCLRNSMKPRYALGVSIEWESEIDLLSSYGFKHVFVRNVTDAENIKKKVPCDAIPDLAFYYQCQPRTRMPKTMAIFLTDYINPAIDRSWRDYGTRSFIFQENLAKVCDSLVKKGWYLEFLPCSTWGYGDDRRIALGVASFMQYAEQVHVNMRHYSPQEMIDKVATFEVALCMRFHPHIFSMIAGTPFVSIGKTRKVDLFLKENNLEELRGAWYEGDNFETCDLENTINRTASGANHYSPRFLNLAKNNHEKLMNIKQSIVQSWLV